MNQVCPTCQLPYDPSARTLELGGIILRPDAHELIYGGRFIKVLPAQVNMLACMLRNGGEATVEQLHRAGCKHTTTDVAVVKVQICILRKAMREANMPLEIVTIGRHYTRSYRLEATD